MRRKHFSSFLVLGLLALIAAPAGSQAWGASKSIDLDGKSANAAESSCALTVLSTFPAKIENKVTNKAIGDAFTFKWYSAGPGGFTSSLGAGTTAGVGATWTWQTSQTIYSFTGTSCTGTSANDICFTKTAGPDPVTTRGPFSVPGRSLTSSGVTLSNASLTSSLITFFSPPQVLASVTSSVGQLSSGQIGYTTTATNNSTQPLTVTVPPFPPGCCNDVHQLNCDGTCVYYLTDPLNCGACGNVCAVGTACSSGTCVPVCPEGTTLCGETCVDLQSDPLNCGACGNACGANQICTGGACFTCSPPDQTACDNRCVNIHTDALNCGACGVNCNLLCPSTGQGTCSQGNSCFCVPGSGAPAGLVTTVVEAPLCEFPGSTDTVPAGGSSTQCQARAVLAKEILSQLTICGDTIPDGDAQCEGGEPASQGIFIKLLPDFTKPIGDAFLSPFHVVITDPSGDGRCQPGETCGLKIAVVNAGPVTVTGASAVFSCPTDDNNPTAVTITGANSAYPAIQGTPISTSTDCNQPLAASTPSTNMNPFMLSLPANHPGDVSRPCNLYFTGTAGIASMDVPITLGIAGKCEAPNLARTYDGLQGLTSPMAALVPAGEGYTVLFPSKALSQGKSFPMKLRLFCGSTNLTGSQVDPPQIVALSEATLGPINITTINLNDESNSNDPFFKFNTSTLQWSYRVRTKQLAKGTYTITLRIANQKDYVTGFVLN